MKGSEPGPCYNIKTLSMYWDFHYKDKTVIRPSCFYNGNTYLYCKTTYTETAPCIWNSATPSAEIQQKMSWADIIACITELTTYFPGMITLPDLFQTHVGARTRWTPLWQTNTFKFKFVNENVLFSIINSPMFVPKGPINNIAALLQLMAWRQSGDKPLSEPLMV